MIARSLSQLFALSLAALTFWAAVSAPNVIDPEFAGMLYVLFALLVLVFFATLFFAMRFAVSNSKIYWGVENSNKQVFRVFLLILIALAVHLAVGWFFELEGRLEETAIISSLLTWTIVPAIFVGLGFVKAPTRIENATLRQMILTGAAALFISFSFSAYKFSFGQTRLEMAGSDQAFISIGNILTAAAAEEIVFRVLLLTALLDLTRSRFNAVFLSSVVFGLVHAPPHLMQPVVYGDWPMLMSAAQAYAPAFLIQTLLGLVLGTIWLRSGSISLVVVAHAIMNVGPTLWTDF